MNRASSEVLNQSTELVGYNLFSSHSVLREALARKGAMETDQAALSELGARLGCVTMFTLGDAANRKRDCHAGQ